MAPVDAVEIPDCYRPTGHPGGQVVYCTDQVHGIDRPAQKDFAQTQAPAMDAKPGTFYFTIRGRITDRTRQANAVPPPRTPRPSLTTESRFPPRAGCAGPDAAGRSAKGH